MSIRKNWILKVHVWDEEGAQFGELYCGSCIEDSMFVRKLSFDEIQDFFRLGERAFICRLNSRGVYVPK
jgi:hypothetical protein